VDVTAAALLEKWVTDGICRGVDLELMRSFERIIVNNTS
jgi:hypothetical protein